MKKLLVVVAAALMFGLTSCMQAPGLTLTPSSLTIKVGETQQLHPGTVGEGIDWGDVVRVEEEGADNIVYYDSYYQVTGLKPGTTKVGICIPEDPDAEKSKAKYSAWSVIKVVE